jgi:hypothetical protein
MYEVESVNRSQMGITSKTCDIRTWKKHLFLDISSTNTDTLVPSLYQCVETRNIEDFLAVFSTISEPPFQLHHQRNVCHPVVKRFKRQTFPANIFLWIFFALNPLTHKKCATERCVILLKHGRHFDYRNQPLNMRMRVCYGDFHEAGLCCYLVVRV